MEIDMIRSDIVKATLNATSSRFLTVTFKKQDGSIRTVNGLLNPTSKMAHKGRVRVHIASLPKSGLVPIWNSAEGWKSFRLDRVVGIKSEGIDMKVKV